MAAVPNRLGFSALILSVPGSVVRVHQVILETALPVILWAFAA